MLRAVEELRPVDDALLSNEGGFEVFVAAVTVLLVAGVALLVWRLVRVLRRGGQALDQRRVPSLASRLQELDDLHRRGVISDAEHQLARQQVLTSS